ncbi:methyltransferase-like protein 13 [Tanacetum coccineum]
MAHPQFPALDQIKSWRPIEFVIENPLVCNPLLTTDNVRVITIDRPPQPEGGTFLIGRLIVPKGRENDSLFSSLPGQIRLLNNYFNVNRLLLISNHPSGDVNSNHTYSRSEDEESALTDAKAGLDHLLSMFNPNDKIFESRYVSYDDGLQFRRLLMGFKGLKVGAFTVVDEVVKDSVGMMSVRRRLRFDATANWLQADVKMHVREGKRDIKDQDLDITKIDQYYINNVDFGMLSVDGSSAAAAMLYGLTLRSPSSGSVSDPERALCFGVRGVIVPLFLRLKLDFKVVGVEPDENLMAAFRTFFDMPSKVKILCHPISEFIEALGKRKPNKGHKWNKDKKFINENFSVITMDFSTFSRCSTSGMCVCAPPPDLATKETFRILKSRLCPYGALIMHAIAPDYLFYQDLVEKLKQIFPLVFELKIGSESEYVIVALNGATRIPPDDDSVKANLRNLLPKFQFKEV